jgi:hypothetical protein
VNPHHRDAASRAPYPNAGANIDFGLGGKRFGLDKRGDDVIG